MYRKGFVMARKRSTVMAKRLVLEQYKKAKLTLKKETSMGEVDGVEEFDAEVLS